MECVVIGAILLVASVICSNICMYKAGFLNGYKECVEDTCEFLENECMVKEGCEDDEAD